MFLKEICRGEETALIFGCFLDFFDFGGRGSGAWGVLDGVGSLGGLVIEG